MSAAAATVSGPRLDVDYLDTDPAQALAQDDTLALFGFGRDAPHHDDPSRRHELLVEIDGVHG